MHGESVLFGLGLAAAWFAASHSHRPHMRRTAAVLIATWLGVMAATSYTGQSDPLIAFLFVDALAAGILLQHPAMRLQAAIGLVYVAQIIAHFLRLVTAWDDVGEYLNILAAGGWLQIIILIGGALYGRRGRLAFSGYRRGDYRAAVAAYCRRMGKPE